MEPFALLVDFDNVRILRTQPGWRRRRWRAQNHRDVVLVQYVHGAANQAKSNLPSAGSISAQANSATRTLVNPTSAIMRAVFFPKRFRRLVGIVVNAKQKRPGGGTAGKTRGRLGPNRQPDTGGTHQGQSATKKFTPGQERSKYTCFPQNCLSTGTFSTQPKRLSRKSLLCSCVVWRGPVLSEVEGALAPVRA